MVRTYLPSLTPCCSPMQRKFSCVCTCDYCMLSSYILERFVYVCCYCVCIHMYVCRFRHMKTSLRKSPQKLKASHKRKQTSEYVKVALYVWVLRRWTPDIVMCMTFPCCTVTYDCAIDALSATLGCPEWGQARVGGQASCLEGAEQGEQRPPHRGALCAFC